MVIVFWLATVTSFLATMALKPWLASSKLSPLLSSLRPHLNFLLNLIDSNLHFCSSNTTFDNHRFILPACTIHYLWRDIYGLAGYFADLRSRKTCRTVGSQVMGICRYSSCSYFFRTHQGFRKLAHGALHWCETVALKSIGLCFPTRGRKWNLLNQSFLCFIPLLFFDLLISSG